MPATLQEMYFPTEQNMLDAITWLQTNQTTPDDYTLQAQGQYEDDDGLHDWYFLRIWFASVSPLAVDYYNANEHLMFDPWYIPPEDPEEPQVTTQAAAPATLQGNGQGKDGKK